jgi:hypothetical protein
VGRKKAKRKVEGPKRTASGSRDRTAARPTSSTGREQRFTSIVPVRFEPAMLEEVRERAYADGRSVSAWIRRAVEAELVRSAEPAQNVGTDTPSRTRS